MTAQVFRGTSFLDTLAAELAATPKGERDNTLFYKTRVAIEREAGTPDQIREALTRASVESGRTDMQRIADTLDSAFGTDPETRTPAGLSPIPVEDWEGVWDSTWPRVIGMRFEPDGEDENGQPKFAKRPNNKRWQYPWSEANDRIKSGDFYAVVIPPGLAVLDVDDPAAFDALGLTYPDNAPTYPSVSGRGRHVWFRLDPDRPYPPKTTGAWAGADRLVGGMGIANVGLPADSMANISALPSPADIPLAPDWFYPAAEEPKDAEEEEREVYKRPLFHLIEDVIVDASQTDIPWVITDLLYYRGAFLLAGAPKVGKSTMLADIVRARHADKNRSFASLEVGQGPTLLLTEEGPMPTAWRWQRTGGMEVMFRFEALSAWAEDRRQNANQRLPAAVLEEAWSFSGWVARRVREWAEDARVNDRRNAVIIVDTLAIWGGMEDENDASQATKAISLWTNLAQETGACVILVHHMRKSGGASGDGIRGSSAILGTADGSWEITRVSENPNDTRRRINVLSRMAFPTTLTVDFLPECAEYSLVSAPEEDTDALLRDIPTDGDGKTVGDMAAIWEITRSAAQKRCGSLVREGKIVRDLRRVGSRDTWLYWRTSTVPAPGRGGGTFREVFDADDE